MSHFKGNVLYWFHLNANSMSLLSADDLATAQSEKYSPVRPSTSSDTAR